MLGLPVPPATDSGESSIELIRSWMIDGGLYHSLQTDAFSGEPENWGIVLADVAQHLAYVISEENDLDQTKVLAQIIRAFNDEAQQRPE